MTNVTCRIFFDGSFHRDNTPAGIMARLHGASATKDRGPVGLEDPTYSPEETIAALAIEIERNSCEVSKERA